MTRLACGVESDFLSHGLFVLAKFEIQKTRGERQIRKGLQSSGVNVGLVKECALGVLVGTWWRYGPGVGKMSRFVAG